MKASDREGKAERRIIDKLKKRPNIQAITSPTAYPPETDEEEEQFEVTGIWLASLRTPASRQHSPSRRSTIASALLEKEHMGIKTRHKLANVLHSSTVAN